MFRKLFDWFLYDRDFLYERVNTIYITNTTLLHDKIQCYFLWLLLQYLVFIINILIESFDVPEDSMIALNQLRKNAGVYTFKKGAEFLLEIIHLACSQNFSKNWHWTNWKLAKQNLTLICSPTYTDTYPLVCLQACNFIKMRLQKRCVPVNIAKCLRTPILKNICERLLRNLLPTRFWASCDIFFSYANYKTIIKRYHELKNCCMKRV